jgi:UPF0755 protein
MKYSSLHILRASVYIFCGVVLVYGYYITRTIPQNFPIGRSFVVQEDETLRSVSMRLEREGYIHSAFWFRAWISFLGSDRHVQLGGYTFTKPLVLGAVIKKLVEETPETPLVKVTFPEGSTVEEIAKLLHIEIPSISESIFIEKVRILDAYGRLFPSTYFLLPSTNENSSIDVMLKTFDKKYKELLLTKAIPKELTTMNDIISLAAILEGEAKGVEDKRIVAGILLSRLEKGMLLQVDVAKETYITKGLPEKPINNPGIIAITAVLQPIRTEYLFYLTGKDGTMHYSKTFAEHKKNIQRYLR